MFMLECSCTWTFLFMLVMSPMQNLRVFAIPECNRWKSPSFFGSLLLLKDLNQPVFELRQNNQHQSFTWDRGASIPSIVRFSIPNTRGAVANSVHCQLVVESGHRRRISRSLSLCSSYDETTNINLLPEIEAHLYRQLFDSPFRIPAELLRIAWTVNWW